MTTNGKLLLVSDLEGCNLYGPPPNRDFQSQVMCGQEFFDAIGVFLADKNNKVAFLGDYFDQGPLVVDSINSIVELHKRFEGQVIVILGNRDINKLRLIYELRPEIQVSEGLNWALWVPFYTEVQKTIPIKERLKVILNKSMGAPASIPQLDPALNENEAAYLLLRAFSKPIADTIINSVESAEKLDANPKFRLFVESVRRLFQIGKIVTYDSDFKTLLSHAGGAEPFILHTETYYDTIKAKLSSIGAYYDKIEAVRLILQEGPAEKTTKFVEDTYNNILKIIPAMFDDTNDPSAEFFILQGLGLKPNSNRHFNSFIQSCDIQGCKGPYGDDLAIDPPLDYNTFLKQLEACNINFIAHGHVPHCVPLPLVYKRPESNIIFIANDTSNGYRPADITRVDQVPLSYITKDGKAGVFSLPGSTDNTYDAGSMFRPMIKEWDLSTVPRFLTDLPVGPRVQYPEGRTLTFPARTPPNGPFTPAAMIGGKTRNKKIKKRRTNKIKKNKNSKVKKLYSN